MSLPRRPGMTLVEMLVATAATLLLMAAIAQVFGAFGSAITNSRSVLEMDARIRSAAWRLRSDLAGTTARMLPPNPSDAGAGYFEIIEGPANDATDATTGAIVTGTTPVVPTDCDDVLLFTTRSGDAPFVGRAPTSSTNAAYLIDTFESTVAEVAWFARLTPGSANPPTYTLYRRQLLVMGYVGTDPYYSSPGADNSIAWSSYGSWRAYFDAPVDVSARLEANTAESRLFPNTLSDLARREARFMHNVTGTVSAAAFPFRFVNHQLPSLSLTTEVLPPALDGLIFDSSSGRYGEDVVLTNVIAFDVRVFDPAVPVVMGAGGTPLVPADSGYTGTHVASGAYVDLGHGVTANALTSPNDVHPRFGRGGDPRSKLDPANDGNRRTFDTWTTHYEANGKDEDLDSVVDEGTDSLDNDGDGRIDEPPYDANGNGVYTDAGEDSGEFETLPPYPYPLRGIEIRIRCYEPASRQVRQVTVRHTFVPH